MLAITISFQIGAPAYAGEQVGFPVCYLHGRRLLELHLAKRLWQKHFVQLVSIGRMLLAC
jgi:hypothetical protein